MAHIYHDQSRVWCIDTLYIAPLHVWFENCTDECSSIIWELIFYKFKLSHNATKATKNICCAKGEGTVHHNNQMVQEIPLRLQEPQSSKVRKALKCEFQSRTSKQRQTWHLTVQCDLSSSQPQQKHPKLLNYASHYQNIGKLLTYPSIYQTPLPWSNF